ncbi:hypothetical protein D9V41_05230 [Aeromicrobium phragmitis]|uniref:Flagellar protein n=1 Tax=Aeromicrobium phragmitis TaxID=2478914 RepID=A0A3L8PMB4_9ACTN|nr:flagellar biosynthetic protein FliO [Aeromicrobium phragmitis]RLV56481.1 hypothetical protein D9V41_05230 [Aeromicrobium phragmitis]
MLELTLRLVASLAIVIGLLLLVTRWGSRRFAGRTDAPVRVLARQSLSRGSSVAVVAVGERMLVVGATEHSVQLLTELDGGDWPDAEPVEPIELAARRGGAHAAPPAATPLQGSLLSKQTWQQALEAARGRSAS